MKSWELKGIPGPKPHFFHGNCLEIREKGLPACHLEWSRIYGKVFGYYIGGTPYLLVSDTELAKEILKTNFQSFSNRPISSNGFMVPVGMESKLLIFQKDQKWKTQRFHWKTFFNPQNIEQLFPHLDYVIHDFLTNLENKKDASIATDVYDMYQKLTMEIIGRVLLGADSLESPKVIQTFRRVLDKKSKKWPISIACFPEFDLIMIPIIRLIEMIKNALGKSKIYDFILDFKDFMKNKHHLHNNNANDFVTKMSNHNIPMETLVADCFALLFGGFETISITLLHATRMLIKENRAQGILRDQIQLDNNSNLLNYSKLNEMKYLDAVIKEVLRCYNPVPGFIRRQSNQDYYRNGVKILSKGDVVQISMAALHKDEQYWPKPDQFLPERFLKEGSVSPDSLNYVPFGAGRRNCVAMHFAMTTTKLVLYRLVERFQLLEEDNVQQEIPTKNSIIRVVPKQGLKVKLLKV